MSDNVLRAGLIRLAHAHPEFRKDLLPLITAGCEKKEEGSKEAADRGTGGYVLRVEKGKYRGSYRFPTPQEAVSAAGDHASFSDKDETKGLALLQEGKPWSVDSSAGSFTISPPKGNSKEAASRIATMAVIRRPVTITVRVLGVKSIPEKVGYTAVSGQMTLDFGGSIEPDAVRFAADIEDMGGGMEVRTFVPLRAVSGGGADVLIGVLKSALQEALDVRGDALLGHG